MADTEKPSTARSQQAAQVADANVPDARHAQRTATQTNPSDNDRMTSREHPLSREPVERVQHADRAVPPGTTTNDRPGPLSPKDRERFAYLSSKTPNPNVLPPSVRTEDEEHEFRKLSKVVADAERQEALERARPEVHLAPQARLDELKAKGDLGEGETIEARRIEELLRDEKRVEELKGMDKRVPEEDDELTMLQARVTEARAAGGFDPNG